MTETDVHDVLDSLRDGGLSTVEVFAKEGQGRRYSREGHRHQTLARRERGWAVRAGDDRCSFFATGVGRPTSVVDWPSPDGYALSLPDSFEVPPWKEPAEIEAPLAGEVEARELVAGVTRSLEVELPGASIELALLEEGSSESELVSSNGVDVRWRQRAAFFRLEGSWNRARVEIERAARSARDFHPRRIAQELADRLLVLGEGEAPERDRAEMVLSPSVGARLVEALRPLVTGSDVEARARSLVDRRGRLAAELLTLVDDGRRDGGLLSAPVDGEGVPTGRRVLIQRGDLGSALVDWRAASSKPVPGALRRSSWRDLPAPGPSHLFVEPATEAPSPTDLLRGVARGYYLVEMTGSPVIDWRHDRLALPVCGYAIGGGEARSPVSGAWLSGSIGSFLRGIQAVGRDLVFLPIGGMIGCPTLLVTGLEIGPSPS